MKKLLFASFLVNAFYAQAGVIQDIERQNIHHFEVSQSFGSLCVYHFEFKENQEQTIAHLVGEIKKEKVVLKVSSSVLEKSNYALIKLNCALNPTAIMFLGDSIDFVEGRESMLTTKAQVSVIFNNHQVKSLPIHTSDYQALRTENAWGEKSISFDNQDHLYLDMVKFK